MITSTAIAAQLISDERDQKSNIHSWRECYEYFGLRDGSFRDEHAALRLAFYLASWGMFRGSSKLGKYGVVAFIPLVELLRAPEFRSLRGMSITDALNRTADVFQLLGQIGSVLRETMPSVSCTETLKTKIALGAVACLPAYDRYLVDGAKALGWPTALSPKGYSDLLRRALQDSDFQQFRSKVAQASIRLPDMRLLDAYLNYRGLMQSS